MASALSATSGNSVQDVLKHVSSMHEYIEQAPHRINIACFAGGAAVVLHGIFGVLNIFAVMDNTINYVVNFYMVLFGVVTCVTESHPELHPAMHDVLEKIQAWMHEWAKGLTLLWGRGLFYIFQGSLAMVSSGLISVGLIVGAYMIAMGAVCISMHFRNKGKVPNGDYIRITE
eukprot:TRINITY_DN69966_c0_g1_i1.p1 TRINITY_DN69966_c0_g1~~TRINITY_DN69966_c0_g1_i1.p1  ORF type:complete len:173 (+),score=15.21 TRINITY_DN69966_c0_g1_i1:57-575(+)